MENSMSPFYFFFLHWSPFGQNHSTTTTQKETETEKPTVNYSIRGIKVQYAAISKGLSQSNILFKREIHIFVERFSRHMRMCVCLTTNANYGFFTSYVHTYGFFFVPLFPYVCSRFLYCYVKRATITFIHISGIEWQTKLNISLQCNLNTYIFGFIERVQHAQ